MRFLLFTSLFLLASSYAKAHEFYFSYAEIEWNDFEERFAGTLIFTQHDIERALSIDLSAERLGASYSTKLMDYVNQHLQINARSWSYFGHESKLTGEFYLYLQSEKGAFPAKPVVNTHFDLLMDEFPDQQNKLTLEIRGKKYHAVYLGHDRHESIELEAIKPYEE